MLRFQSLLTLLLFAAFAAVIGFFMAEANYDWQGLVLVTAVIGIIAIFLIPRLAQLENGDFLLKVLSFGLLLKLGFAMVRYWFELVAYEGFVDAYRYHHSGIVIAQHICRLEFEEVTPFLQWGTKFIEFFTGVIYSVVGPTLYGGYLIYSLLAFLGSYYFYKAFRVAFPEGNKRLYALLVFFFPSMLFWSNGIGKDALILLCLGLFAYGSAQLTRERLQGLVPLVLGLFGVIYIRPHIAAMLAFALVLAFVVRGAGKGATRPAIFVTGLLMAACLAWFLLPRVMAYIGLEELSPEGVISQLQMRQSLTFYGGSAFQVGNILNPVTFPIAMTTLLFRPFPWEAHNIQALIQSLEGVLVTVLILWRIKSLGKAVASSISNTYLRYILIFIIGFIIAFSVISNFGLMARERAMVLPFFFMLIAYSGPGALIESKPNGVLTSQMWPVSASGSL
jgi:hypothetical protein